MKALEKAAKDRADARPKQPETPTSEQPSAVSETGVTPPLAKEPEATTAPAKQQLTLEPLAAVKPRGDTAEPGASQPAPRRLDNAPRERESDAPRGRNAGAAERERAATVLSASQRPAGGAGAYIRQHPRIVFGGLVGLFVLGFGIYVYLQIFHPGIFIRQAPRPAAPPLTQAPTQPTPSPAVAAASSVPAPEPVPEPLATAPFLQQAALADAPQTIPAAPAAPTQPPLSATPAPAPAPKAERSAPQAVIAISKGMAKPEVNPILFEAYAALTADRLDAAGELYSRLLKSEPKNRDALLGLAAIAVRQGREEEATQHYMKLLEADPRDALAQSGLIALLGRADPLAAESRLKHLITREPSAYLYFTLGNLYADQSLWAQAQQAYFRAFHLEPANPDYAYNLAVGLEHISQQKLALDFYRRAVSLASRSARVNFDLSQAKERIGKLAALGE